MIHNTMRYMIKKINSQYSSCFNNYEHDYLNIVPISKYYIFIYTHTYIYFKSQM